MRAKPLRAIFLGLPLLANGAAGTSDEKARTMTTIPPSGAPASAYVGKPADPATLNGLMAATGTSKVRIIKRGDMVTMEHMSGRLTIVIDEEGRIVRTFKG